MDTPIKAHVEAVRRFSRFYTKQVGPLNEGLLESAYSLTEVRVLYELVREDARNASEVAAALGVDPGYLSRILKRLKKRGVVSTERSKDDRRRILLAATPAGRRLFKALDKISSRQIQAMLAGLSPADQAQAVDAMRSIETLFGPPPPNESSPLRLRPPGPGDMGWVVQRHGELYTELRGWDATFEALVADIASKFVRNFDPAKERGWIAEIDGARLGSIFLTRHSKTVGQLRMLIVEPAARGRGIGARLVGECVSHARHVGYKKMGLYTSKGLDSARRLYEAEGFQLVKEETEQVWGKTHMAQWWELQL